MSATYGITPQGFIVKQQQEIITEIQGVIAAGFGSNTNFGAESVIGQLVGIFSEREALIWQLAEAVYDSQYPSGAEGTSVDNILALNNLRRLPAKPTITNPEPIVNTTTDITTYGLVLFGTPGTVIEQGAIIQTNATPPVSCTLDAQVTIAAAVSAVQTVYLSNSPTTGQFSLSIVDTAGNVLITNLIQWNALASSSIVGFSGVPVTGAFTLTLTAGGVPLTTASIPYTAGAADVQSAIQALTGYSGATVTGNFSTGFTIAWGVGIPNPLVTSTTNTLGVTLTPVDSVQGITNNILDADTTLYPYTDVQVTSFMTGFVFNFGVGTPIGSNPNSASQPVSIFSIASNTMENGTTATNINIINTTIGAAAQAVGSATCTVDGPNFIGAGTLSVIGSPTSGWTSVTNQLDCITGTNVEDDTQALTRRSTLLSAQANGPLASIIQKVSEVAGVTNVVGFENIYEAALQLIAFGSTPVSGSFSLTIGSTSTGSIAFSATAADVQSAIRAVSGYGTTIVSGSFDAGFTVDFAGSQGGQPQNLMTAATNTLGVGITFTFGRPGKSFEIVVQGGANTDIANAILASKPAGIQAYGVTTTLTVFDIYGNPYLIGFSRPTQVPIFMTLNLTTDLQTAAQPQFNVGSIQTIQQDLIAIGNAVGIGGLIIGFGTNGLIGAFNDVPGIINYTMAFGRSASPSSNTNIPMQPEEVPAFETFNIIVSYT